MPIRIVLADDHVLVRQGLKSLLEREKFQILAEASDGQDAVRLTETHHPDIAIFDISMPTLNGIDAARQLGRSCPKTKAILLTQHEEEQYIHEALEAGVKGYVLKNQVASDLIHAIQQVSRGEFYLSPGISRAVMEAYRTKADRRADSLSGKSAGDPFILARASHGRLLTLICPKRMTQPIPFQGASARFFN
jgi:DNA-binding NarL/FixJ family response regulator